MKMVEVKSECIHMRDQNSHHTMLAQPKPSQPIESSNFPTPWNRGRLPGISSCKGENSRTQ